MDLDFEGEGMFYPGAFTEEDKKHVRQSELWPLLLGVHYAVGNAAFIAFTIYNNNVASAANLRRVDMVDRTGTRRVSIKIRDAAYEIRYLSTTGNEVTKDPIVKSKNYRYILNKINNDENKITENLRKHFSDGPVSVANYLNHGIQKLLQDVRPAKIDDALLDGETSRHLTLAYGNPEFSLPTSVIEKVDSYAEKYRRLMADYASGIKLIEDLIGGPKWLFMGYERSLYCAAVNLNAMDSVRRFVSRGSFAFEYDTPAFIHPLRAYKSSGHFNPEYREDAMAAWTIFKMYMEKYKATVVPSHWKGGMVPATGYCRLSDAGALMWDDSNLHFLLLDKP